MMSERIKIAVCRKLKTTEVVKAFKSGIDFDDIDLLTIEYPYPSDTFISALNSELPLVFTSIHSLYWFKLPHLAYLAANRKQGVYVISGKTQAEALSVGFRVIASAENTKYLANRIVEHNESEVIHISTQIRRDEIDEILALHQIGITVVEAYTKKIINHKFDSFSGVAFFSPSQVDGFLACNTLKPIIPAFSIGTTTAKHLANLGHQNILIAPKPTETDVVNLIIHYFTKNKNEQQA